MANLFTTRMDIPLPVKAMITEVVNKDEGGWNLNPPDSNDQDGGWTFGGVTSALYNQCYTAEGQKSIDRGTIEKVIASQEGVQHMIDDCLQIYFRKFCVPLATLNPHSSLEINIPEITAMELSCFINVGGPRFLLILKAAGSQLDPILYKQNFLGAWRKYYIDLVVENAKAWHEYALEESHGSPPKTFRAIYLHGWLNRVDNYA